MDAAIVPKASLDYPAPIIVEPRLSGEQNSASACVIWLHGLGADGHDFEGILPDLGLPENHAIRFVFPTAAKQAVTANMGMTMRAWYDIASLKLRDDLDLPGIQLSVNYIASLVDAELAKGITPNKILLAGFSQGGVIALMTGLTTHYSFAGVLALSTYFPEMEQVLPLTQSNMAMPIMMAHGLQDSVCKLEDAEISRQQIEQQGYHIDWYCYPMAHQVCVEEINDIAKFIQQSLLK